MIEKELSSSIIESLLQNKFHEYFKFPHTDDITNQVRAELEKLSEKDHESVICNMEKCLTATFQDETEDNFILKENIIYYLGREKNANYLLLRNLYFKQSNPHMKLNLFFSLLPSFDEEVEFDFINRITPGNEYDNLIRSWTMAFFANVENPFEYKDTGKDDPRKAINARLNRFTALLDKNNHKYPKASLYVLIDLIVLSLFINSRGFDVLSDDDYKTIERIPEYYEQFSESKNEKIVNAKKRILYISQNSRA